MYLTHRLASARTRGSSLVAVMVFVTVMSAAMAGVLSYTSNTHRNSNRQGAFEQARLVAESEMEYLFNGWQLQAYAGHTGDDLQAQIAAAGYIVTNADPFSAGVKSQGLAIAPIVSPATTGGWRVTRALVFMGIPGRPDQGASGLVPGTQKLGHNYYYEAKVTASITHPVFGTMQYKAARRFVQTETSLFQNAIYYQDDLEIAASGVLIVNGDISCSGNAYLGAQGATGPASELVICGTARIYGTINGVTIDGTGAIGTTTASMRKPGASGTSALHLPEFDPDGASPYPTDQTAQRVVQVQKLNSKENVLGGVDVLTAMTTYPSAYRNDPTLAYNATTNPADSNQVYRSVIAPPQQAVSPESGTISEDPTIASRRMYTRAGIIVTINGTTMSVGTAADPTIYDSTMGTDMALVIPLATRRQTMADQRENSNIKVSDVDISLLIAKIASNSYISAAYNGVIYVHDTTVTSGFLNAIRLVNATATPAITDSVTNQPKGFTVVSNNGIYVKGDYNTVATSTTAGVSHYNPCLIMGDAITVLSPGFADTSLASSASIIAGNRLATADITVNSALISGNTPSGTGTSSGGVQNLIRYLENWGGRTATFHGSLSQLFVSKYFSGGYIVVDSLNNVYRTPTSRKFEFDTDLADTPPALSPKSSNYFRGDFFTF